MLSMSSYHQVDTKNVGDTYSWSSQQCCRDYSVNAFLSPGGYKERRGHLFLVQSAVLQGTVLSMSFCHQVGTKNVGDTHSWSSQQCCRDYAINALYHQVDTKNVGDTHSWSSQQCCRDCAINVFLSPGGYKERRGHPLLVQSQQCCRDYAINAFLSPGGYKERRGHLLLVQSAVLQGLCHQCLPITRCVQRT